ncbi:hypothetical protein CY35_08G091800 [Sphagnum magellanicum]|nr:hypothetical protein CY35_08G091800 [Sphagnum magellanicum]
MLLSRFQMESTTENLLLHLPNVMEEKREIVIDLVKKIEMGTETEIELAVIDLRLLTKHDVESRQFIAEANGIQLLIPLLDSPKGIIQENAITTLLNLSISDGNRALIMETSGAWDAIFKLLGAGVTDEAKENAAATIFSLLIVEEYRERVGEKPGTLSELLQILKEVHTHRGKKDVIKVIYHLALHEPNKARLVMVGAIPVLFSFILQRRLVEDALSVLALLGSCPEGVTAMTRVGELTTIVEVLRGGSTRAKENATSVLLALCETGGDSAVEKVSRHNHAIVATLCSLLITGSDRGKRKAKSLMRFLVANESSSSSIDSSSSFLDNEY